MPVLSNFKTNKLATSSIDSYTAKVSEAKEKITVLFLCTGNACRSQMAEGWARHLKSDVIEAFSAGVSPAGVSTRAITVMDEAGVDISSQASKCLNIFSSRCACVSESKAILFMNIDILLRVIFYES